LTVFPRVYSGPSLPAGKTADNLLTAYKAELAASAKYTAFAEEAHKDGHHQIGILFNAVARAEAIHAANHKTVLEKMGIKVQPYTPVFTVKTTKENLEEAISGESAEVNSLYPGWIATAKSENASSAVKSMRWAMETERRHTIFLQNALTTLQNNTASQLPRFYWVCPKCGNTYDVAKPEGMCSFCGTASTRFEKIFK
jgi:rubrerythrin